MDIEVMKSYLVNLGFAVNQPELRKFELALKDAAMAVTTRTSGVVADLLKWQAGATSAFVGISGAIIAMADHAANADNKFRLMGMRMFMTTEQTRKMQTSLESLGVTLEEAIWDPETRARFIELGELQDRLSARLGTNFSANMVTIRNMQQRFRELRIEVEYLSMTFISKLVEKFGPQLERIQSQIEGFVDYVIDHMDEWTKFMSDNLGPVLVDTWGIVKELGGAMADLGLLFTNLVGLFSGDHSIEGSTFNFHNMALAIGHVVGWVEGLIHAVMHAEEMLIHFANALALVFSFKFKEAGQELAAGLADLTTGSGAVIGGVGGAGVGGAVGGGLGAWIGGALGTALLGPGVGTAIGVGIGTALGGGVGTGVGAGVGAGVGGSVGSLKQAAFPSDPDAQKTSFSLPQGQTKRTAITDLIDKYALAHGVDPRVAEALASQESGQRQFGKNGGVIEGPATRSGERAHGVMQLMPGTANALGLNRDDTAQNVEGGVTTLKRLLGKYQSLPKALAAYNWGEGHLDDAIKRHSTQIPAETLNYVHNIMAQGTGQNMTVGDITIAITEPGVGHDQIAAAVTKGIKDAAATQQKQTQRNVAQLAYVG